ncbi:hypothetical protein LWI29_028812 [Acer saccharum]|uniref:Uncharacterized protein n=1 Tax=Acer saccharum TaxID=4024 RepID=A0AA39T769_ACESA|nr:hypothetical protein LWI29_028812 [Acer saccharum]KAK1582970.1 hypothetical protein Q3G72_019862 [Acer saccharum]
MFARSDPLPPLVGDLRLMRGLVYKSQRQVCRMENFIKFRMLSGVAQYQSGYVVLCSSTEIEARPHLQAGRAKIF